MRIKTIAVLAIALAALTGWVLAEGNSTAQIRYAKVRGKVLSVSSEQIQVTDKNETVHEITVNAGTKTFRAAAREDRANIQSGETVVVRMDAATGIAKRIDIIPTVQSFLENNPQRR